MPDRSLLLVHAHPDDETIATGGTMARYAAEGVHVALVTCTRGEHGDIVAPDLQELGQGKLLADARSAELAAAMDELGIDDHRFLGPYEDSGMMGTPPNERPTAFWQADLDEAAAHLALVVDEVRPQVVVTYDPTGGYGHPDHIQAHRVTLLALDRSAHNPAKLYHVLWRDEARPTTRIDISAYVERKLAALRCHRTQLGVVDRTFALSSGVPHQVLDEELFVLARGTLGAAEADETDLFAGVGQ